MPEDVVDLLELVEIHHQHGIVCADRLLCMDLFPEQGTIRQLGQSVVRGVPSETLDELGVLPRGGEMAGQDAQHLEIAAVETRCRTEPISHGDDAEGAPLMADRSDDGVAHIATCEPPPQSGVLGRSLDDGVAAVREGFNSQRVQRHATTRSDGEPVVLVHGHDLAAQIALDAPVRHGLVEDDQLGRCRAQHTADLRQRKARQGLRRLRLQLLVDDEFVRRGQRPVSARSDRVCGVAPDRHRDQQAHQHGAANAVFEQHRHRGSEHGAGGAQCGGCQEGQRQCRAGSVGRRAAGSRRGPSSS